MRWIAIVLFIFMTGCGWFHTRPTSFVLPVGKIPIIRPPDEPPVKPTAILKAGKYPITISKPKGFYYSNVAHGRLRWREELWELYAESLRDEIKKHNEIIEKLEKKR